MLLCNGASSIVLNVIYDTNHQPPHLPIAVIVKFDNHRGPSISNIQVVYQQLCPMTVISNTSDGVHERQKTALKTCLGNMTIHNSQGLTFAKAWIDMVKVKKLHASLR